MAIVKIEGNNNLYRDTNSKAILNTDNPIGSTFLKSVFEIFKPIFPIIYFW